MDRLCEFCGNQRSIVHCPSDAACLCFSCDRIVHSENAFFFRHSRYLVCERCHSNPATVRCAEEEKSLCQNCDWNGHSDSASFSIHKRLRINSYTGCPSAAELLGIWPFVLGFPSITGSNCEQGLGLMNINEISVSRYWGPPDNNNTMDQIAAGRKDYVENADKTGMWMGPSSEPALNSIPCSVDQAARSMNPTTPKDSFPASVLHVAAAVGWLPLQSTEQLSCSGTNGAGLCSGDALNEDFSVDDVDLNFENYEELFGVSQNNLEQLFENSGIDSLLGMHNVSAADFKCGNEFVTEGASTGPVKAVHLACRNAASADSLMNTKIEPELCFPAMQAHSSLSLSFSSLTGESSAGDYQDCGASSMLLMVEPPWYPPRPHNSFPSSSRDSAVIRYKEKKKTRMFQKKIRYASRKARADIRKRVKGRFVKAGDSYDYDPMCKIGRE